MKNEKLKIKKYAHILIILLFLVFGIWYLVFNIKNKPLNQPLNQPSITTIKVAMGYIPNVQFAPFYVALEKGYFKDQGLEPDFNYGMETDLVALLAKDELKFSLASGEQVILAQAKGLPVVNFFNWYQRFPVVITSLKAKNITKPQDLIGKTIGIPAVQGASFIGWQAFLKKNDLPEKQIRLQIIGYTQAASLTEKKVDAAICYRMNEPVQLESKGYEVNNLEVADWANLVSNGLLTNQKTIDEQSQLVKAFALAFSQGLKDTINNPDEAFLISKKYIPEIKDEAVQKAVLAESIRFWQTENLGQNSQEQWQQSVNILLDLGLIDKQINPDNLWTNQFLP